MDEFTDGLGDAWAAIATFVPKLLAFLLILVIGYFIAKAIAKVLDGILERVGFDRAVERGGVGQALAQSRFDASDILGKIVFWALFLFVLQMAFGVFGPNPISDLIKSVISYLPKLFMAIVIVVIGAAIAAAVKEVIEAALGGLSYGKALAFAASTAILVVTFFAALAQLDLDAADKIFNPIFYSILAIIVGSAIVAIGGGGIQTMSRYWQRAAQRAEIESSNMKQQAQGSKQRIQQRASERMEQARSQSPQAQPGATTRSPQQP